FVLLNHPANPLHLSCEVAVVGAGMCAGGDQGFTIQGIRPDGGNHQAGTLAQRIQRQTVAGISNDDGRPRRVAIKLTDQAFQFFGRAPCDSPPELTAGKMLAQILTKYAAYKAACAKYD